MAARDESTSDRVPRAARKRATGDGRTRAQLGAAGQAQRATRRRARSIGIAVPTIAAPALLAQAMARLSLSARAYHRILKVARTIADLDDEKTIRAPHVAEAIGYRRFDRM